MRHFSTNSDTLGEGSLMCFSGLFQEISIPDFRSEVPRKFGRGMNLKGLLYVERLD